MLWACHLHAMCHAQQLCITNKMTGRMSIASNSESASGRLLTKRKSHVEVTLRGNVSFQVSTECRQVEKVCIVNIFGGSNCCNAFRGSFKIRICSLTYGCLRVEFLV